jgi:hypothetical protein
MILPFKIKSRMNDDFETVAAWGTACPTLNDVTLPRTSVWRCYPAEKLIVSGYLDGSQWLRIYDDFWMPDPTDRHSLQWLVNTVRSGNDPDYVQKVTSMQLMADDGDVMRDPVVALSKLRLIADVLGTEVVIRQGQYLLGKIDWGALPVKEEEDGDWSSEHQQTNDE